MPTYTHGGDWYAAGQRFGAPVLDFSANLNPLGMPPAARAAAKAALDAPERYPDPLCRDLREAIAARDGVKPGQIVCGAGGADLIFRLAFALGPRRALVTAPTFSEYASALTAAGCQVDRFPLAAEAGFAVTGALLDVLTPGLDLCVLCSPNNPTGGIIPRALLLEAAARCHALGIVLLVDECFLALSDAPDNGLAGVLEAYSNLVLLRAFTKSYALAGLRLGYCLTANKALAETLYTCGQPWPVSAPAQAAGLAALACPDWPERARALIRAQRPRLAAGLGALGLAVWPSGANYLLFRAAGDITLKDRLLERGVLIRSCANYPGLGPDYYRAAVRPAGEIQTLLDTMGEVL